MFNRRKGKKKPEVDFCSLYVHTQVSSPLHIWYIWKFLSRTKYKEKLEMSEHAVCKKGGKGGKK